MGASQSARAIPCGSDVIQQSHEPGGGGSGGAGGERKEGTFRLGELPTVIYATSFGFLEVRACCQLARISTHVSRAVKMSLTFPRNIVVGTLQYAATGEYYPIVYRWPVFKRICHVAPNVQSYLLKVVRRESSAFFTRDLHRYSNFYVSLHRLAVHPSYRYSEERMIEGLHLPTLDIINLILDVPSFRNLRSMHLLSRREDGNTTTGLEVFSDEPTKFLPNLRRLVVALFGQTLPIADYFAPFHSWAQVTHLRLEIFIRSLSLSVDKLAISREARRTISSLASLRELKLVCMLPARANRLSFGAEQCSHLVPLLKALPSAMELILIETGKSGVEHAPLGASEDGLVLVEVLESRYPHLTTVCRPDYVLCHKS